MSSLDNDFNQDYRKCERYARDIPSWPSTKQYLVSALSQVLPASTPCKSEVSQCTVGVHAAIWFQRQDKDDEDFSESLS